MTDYDQIVASILNDSCQLSETDMDSLLAKAYAEIEKIESAVDQQNDDLRRKIDDAHHAATAPHDGGLIFTLKGRAVGTQDDRAALDRIIDRVTPNAPADPLFATNKTQH